MQQYYHEVDQEMANYYGTEVVLIADRLATPLRRLAMHYAIGEILQVYESAVESGGIEDAQALYEQWHKEIESGESWGCTMPDSLERVNALFYDADMPYLHDLAARVVRYSKDSDIHELAQWLDRIGRYDVVSEGGS